MTISPDSENLIASFPSFSLTLPPVWGIPLAWSLSALPLLPLLVGLLVHLVLAGGHIKINLPLHFPQSYRVSLKKGTLVIFCLISVLEVGFYFFTCVSESEF